MVVKKKGRIKSGISQTGGKFRLVNRLRELTPYHEFFLSMFTGAAHFELNKPRCRYECWNDGESEIINYLVQIHLHPKEFDAMKQGVFGLVSQEICNRIVNGKIQPKNDLERAYYFYYLNKLTFGGSIWKVRKKPPYQGMSVNNLSEKDVEGIKKEFKTKGYIGLIDCGSMSREGYGRVDSKVVENAKRDYEIKTKGYVGMFREGCIGKNIKEKDIEKIKAEFKGIWGEGAKMPRGKAIEDIKASFRGVPPAGFQKKVDDAKASYRGIAPKANFKGIWSNSTINERDNIPKMKKRFKEMNAPYKGTNPKTTRPFTNNDCGLLSPIEPEAIKRLRYVNLTAYDFRKVYKMFYDAFYVRKGLERECFIYADPPYPGTEKYYGDLFSPEFHQDLLALMKETPFNFMLSIGGECDFYLKQLEDWNIVPVKVKYSTSANHQHDSQEYIIMNYEIEGIAKMIMPSNQKLIEKYF